jgi:hypothetical protein
VRARDLKTEPGTIEIGGGFSEGLSLLLRSLVFLAAFFATLALSVPALAQEEGRSREAMFRMANLSPDAPKMDVYVDDERVGTLSDVPFKTVSPYVPLPAGSRNVKVYPANNASDPLLEADVDLDGGVSYTLGAVGRIEDGSLAAKLYEDDNSPPAKGKAKLRMIHAVQDIVAVTAGVKGGEKNLFALPGFSNASDYAEVPAGTYALEVKVAGMDDVAFSIPDITLSAGEVYTAFAVGRATDGSLDIVLADRGGGTSSRDRNEPQYNKEEPQYNEQKAGTDGGKAVTPAGGETGAGELGVDANPVLCLQSLDTLASPDPPTPATESIGNNLLGSITPVTQESIYEGAIVDTTPATPEPTYQGLTYQQPVFYQDNPFMATPVVQEPVYQQPIGEPTIPSLSIAVPDTVGGAIALLDTATEDPTGQENLVTYQEPTQIAGAGQIQVTSSVSNNGDAGSSSVLAEVEPVSISVDSSSANTNHSSVLIE